MYQREGDEIGLEENMNKCKTIIVNFIKLEKNIPRYFFKTFLEIIQKIYYLFSILF